jgi:hypothetical protein
MGDVYSTWKQVRKMEEWRGVQMRMPWTITVE